MAINRGRLLDKDFDDQALTKLDLLDREESAANLFLIDQFLVSDSLAFEPDTVRGKTTHFCLAESWIPVKFFLFDHSLYQGVRQYVE